MFKFSRVFSTIWFIRLDWDYNSGMTYNHNRTKLRTILVGHTASRLHYVQSELDKHDNDHKMYTISVGHTALPKANKTNFPNYKLVQSQ